MLTGFAGTWTGVNRLYFEGADGPMLESKSTLTAAMVINSFLQLHYHWIFKDNPQEGLLLIGRDPADGTVTASFVDTFHQSARVMFLHGSAVENGVTVLGTYEAGEGPPWGWRIDLELYGDVTRMTMFNISPEGTEYLAVAAEYRRD